MLCEARKRVLFLRFGLESTIQPSISRIHGILIFTLFPVCAVCDYTYANKTNTHKLDWMIDDSDVEQVFTFCLIYYFAYVKSRNSRRNGYEKMRNDFLRCRFICCISYYIVRIILWCKVIECQHMFAIGITQCREQ